MSEDTPDGAIVDAKQGHRPTMSLSVKIWMTKTVLGQTDKHDTQTETKRTSTADTTDTIDRTQLDGHGGQDMTFARQTEAEQIDWRCFPNG